MKRDGMSAKPLQPHFSKSKYDRRENEAYFISDVKSSFVPHSEDGSDSNGAIFKRMPLVRAATL